MQSMSVNMYNKMQKEQLTYFAQMDAWNFNDEEIWTRQDDSPLFKVHLFPFVFHTCVLWDTLGIITVIIIDDYII